jgi:hypothetical protein
MITFINAIGDCLEEGDQISIGAEINGGKSGLGHYVQTSPASKPSCSTSAKRELDRLSFCPAC